MQTGCVVESISGSATSGSEDGAGSGGEDESPFSYEGCVSGQGVGTNTIQLNFLFPDQATRVRLNRNGNQIAEFSSANKVTTHIDDDGLREGATYLYTCEALVDGLWSEGTNNLQLSTLAVNAPTFAGIATAVANDSHSVKVTWVPSISDIPVSTFSYKIYANVGDTVDFSVLPRATVLQGGLAEADIDGLGDDLNYVFGVRACSEGDVCETNIVQQGVYTADDGAPLTTGVTALGIVDGILNVTAPWAEAQGGVSRRYIYVRNGAVGGTNVGDYTLERTYLFTGTDLYAPLQTLELTPLQEGQTYHIIVQDEDPSGNRSLVTTFESIDVVDITPPSFGGITNMLRGTPADSVMTLSWTAIDTEVVDPVNGGDKYRILLLSDLTPIANNPCLAGTQVAELDVSAYVSGAAANYDLTGLDEKSYHAVCIKAVDVVGNISTNNNSLQLNTLDITPPDFIGVQAIAFDNQNQALNLSWNASGAADIKEYRVTLWVNQPTVPGSPTVLVKSHADFSTGSPISNAEFPLADNDEAYASVEACDSTEPPFGTQNCSATLVQRSVVVPDVSAPANFLGIRGPTDILTPVEGEFTVVWNAPADWSDYRGFKVYEVDTATNAISLMKTCPCADYGCSDMITQCTVNGLDSYRTYRLHVRAYDDVNNETLYLDPAISYSDKRTIDTTAPTFASNLIVGPSPSFTLSWNAGVDNQYGPEPGAEIQYEVYQNNAPFDFTNPSQPDGNLKTSTTALLFQDNGFVEAQTYYYTVCATDASDNTTCDQLTRTFTVPDVTVPVIANLRSTKTIKSKVWELEWDMNDNISANADLQVELRSRISVAGDLATASDPVVYTGLGGTVIVAGDNASTAQAVTLDPLSGSVDLNRKINYLLIVRDEEGNESQSNITIDINNSLTITDVKGTTGPVSGGKIVTIYGTGFSSAVDNGVGVDTEVLISGNACTGLTVLSENAIICTTPAVAVAGSVEVRVKTQVNNPAAPGNIVESEDSLTNGYTYSGTPILCDDPGSWLALFAAGTGTSLDPYIVCDDTHLANIRPIADSGASFQLGDSIDLNGVSFDPLGDATRKFSGIFDGDGHVILNWTYSAAQPNIGFLGYVNGDFQLSNLGMVNVDITASQSVGGLIGVVEGGVNKTGLISNVFVTGVITADDFVGGIIGRKQNNHVNFNMINSYFVGTVNVNGITGYGGGIAGFLGSDTGGLFQSIYAEGLITGTRFLGGLFGNLGEGKQLQDSFSRAVVNASGNTAGGLVGELKSGSTITNSYSEDGTVTAVDNVGGAAGTSEGDMTDVYSTMVVNSTGRRAGGLIGYATDASVTTSYSTADLNLSQAAGGLIGEMSDSVVLSSYATGDIISTGTDVGGLVGKVFTGSANTSSITKAYATGLLDTTASGVGGLVGSVESLANGTLDISEVFSTSQVGTDFAAPNQQYGGLIGKANTSAGSVFNLTNCYATGSVQTGAQGGGFIGGYDFTGGTINVDFCYSASPILGSATDRGGVFGRSDVGLNNISNSYWDNEISTKVFPSGNGAVNGTVTGHTTGEMQDYANSIYVGWDFATIWIVPISGYPQLRFAN